MTNLTREQMREYQRARVARMRREADGVAPLHGRPLPKDHPLAVRVERARVEAQREYEAPGGRAATAAEVIAAGERAVARVMAEAAADVSAPEFTPAKVGVRKPPAPAIRKPPALEFTPAKAEAYKPSASAPLALRQSPDKPAGRSGQFRPSHPRILHSGEGGMLAIGGKAGKGRAVAGYDPNRAPLGAHAIEINVNALRMADEAAARSEHALAKAEALKRLAAQSEAKAREREAERKSRTDSFIEAGLNVLRIAFGAGAPSQS
jgi:hypothetical protein